MARLAQLEEYMERGSPGQDHSKGQHGLIQILPNRDRTFLSLQNPNLVLLKKTQFGLLSAKLSEKIEIELYWQIEQNCRTLCIPILKLPATYALFVSVYYCI